METIKTHALRLMPGADLRNEIQSYVIEKKIQAGWLVTCVGSLVTYSIRFANQSLASQSNGYFEITGLAGTLSVNGSHIHITVSDIDGGTRGGHLMEGSIIYTTAEIIIAETSAYTFKRVNDGSTPWKELQILFTNNHL